MDNIWRQKLMKKAKSNNQCIKQRIVYEAAVNMQKSRYNAK